MQQNGKQQQQKKRSKRKPAREGFPTAPAGRTAPVRDFSNVGKTRKQKGLTEAEVRALVARYDNTNRGPAAKDLQLAIKQEEAYTRAVAASVALPDPETNRRYEGPGAGAPTALATPVFREDLQWFDTAAPENYQMSKNNLMVVLERRVNGCVRYWKPCPTASTYQAQYDGSLGILASKTLDPMEDWEPMRFTYLSGPSPHGGTMEVRRAYDGRAVVWIDGSALAPSKLVLRIGAGNFPADTELVYRRYQGARMSYTTPSVIAGTGPNLPTYEVNCLEPGWYNFFLDYTRPGAPAAAIDVTVEVVYNYNGDPTGQVFSLNDMKGMDGFEDNVNEIRITGASMTVTPTAPSGYRAGKIISRTFTGDWLDEVEYGSALAGTGMTNFDMYSPVASHSQAKQLGPDLGADSYLIPSGPGAFNMTPVHPETSSSTGRFIEPMMTTSPNEIIVLWSPAPAIAVPIVQNPRQHTLTVKWNVEYTSESTWVTTRRPGMHIMESLKAEAIIARLNNHNCNDFHIKDIWAGIKKAAGVVADVGKVVLPVAAAVAAL